MSQPSTFSLRAPSSCWVPTLIELLLLQHYYKRPCRNIGLDYLSTCSCRHRSICRMVLQSVQTRHRSQKSRHGRRRRKDLYAGRPCRGVAGPRWDSMCRRKAGLVTAQLELTGNGLFTYLSFRVLLTSQMRAFCRSRHPWRYSTSLYFRLAFLLSLWLVGPLFL